MPANDDLYSLIVQSYVVWLDDRLCCSRFDEFLLKMFVYLHLTSHLYYFGESLCLAIHDFIPVLEAESLVGCSHRRANGVGKLLCVNLLKLEGCSFVNQDDLCRGVDSRLILFSRMVLSLTWDDFRTQIRVDSILKNYDYCFCFLKSLKFYFRVNGLSIPWQSYWWSSRSFSTLKLCP